MKGVGINKYHPSVLTKDGILDSSCLLPKAKESQTTSVGDVKHVAWTHCFLCRMPGLE